ncbi:uncharacterized protein LOC118225046 [Anguilla anguilla]|uniref:uncharacterized protein LOC118225046 n=1 Tax=Anguilla anguilla TaxID=7936 RepID=UPI0015AC2398|nr:uncharacterized protein LOC118225046 [Anguilla anguilla]
MDVRIQALEAPSSTSDPRSATYFQGNIRPDISPSAVDDVSYAPPPTVMAPRRTLATAVPAAPAGVPFIPPAAAISPQLRASILAGVPNPVSRRRTFQPAMPNLQPNGARLNASLQTYLSSASHYMRSGLAKSTLKMYDSAWYHFSSFCAAFSVAVSPINISIVCAFVVHCFESRKMQPSSIKTLVAGIQFHLRCMDPSVGSLLGNPSLRLLFNGLMKRSPESIDKRLPLTISLTHKLVSHLRQGCFNPYTDSLLEAVFLTAFYGFLRCGEYTTRTENFDPSIDLTYSNLSFGSQYFIIHLKRSKTDKNAKGTPIIIAQTGTVFVPSLPWHGTCGGVPTRARTSLSSPPTKGTP